MKIFKVVLSSFSFLVILILTFCSYAYMQKVVEFEEGEVNSSYSKNWVLSFGLAFGQMDGYDEFSPFKFTILIIYSFMIVITLLNLLIAIMSSTYA